MTNTFKKDIYSKADRKYFTYYLFLPDSNVSPVQDIESTYTIHINSPIVNKSKADTIQIQSEISVQDSDISAPCTAPTAVPSKPAYCKWTSPKAHKYFLPKHFCESKGRKTI